MKKLTLLILIISIYDLAASLYKAPHSENFTVDASKINDADKIGFTLHLHLYYKLSKQTNYAFAEKSMALSLLLSPKNEAIKVLNTSLIYGLPLGTKTAFSDEELTRRLQADIKNLNTSNNKNNLTLSWYLSDTLKSLTGIEVSPILLLKLKQYKLAPGWQGIIENHHAPPAVTIDTTTTLSAGEFDAQVVLKYAQKDKAVFQKQATVKGLVVSSNNEGVHGGHVAEIIATVRSSHGPASFAFKRKVGRSMVDSLKQAEVALKRRFPNLLHGQHTTVSFTDKFSGKDGNSAGTVITLLLYSIYEGLKFDMNVAITGTISKNWEVGAVGGVASKIRGAIKNKCKYVGIPFDNRYAAQDLALLYNPDDLWKIQIFYLKTLDQAIDLGRLDKSENLNTAIKLFEEIAKKLPHNLKFKSLDRKKEILDQLKQVLTLAPNHMSAQVISKAMQAPKSIRLSFYTSYEEINRMTKDLLRYSDIPKEIVKKSLKRLSKYRTRIDSRVEPLAEQINNVIEIYQKIKAVKYVKIVDDVVYYTQDNLQKFEVLKAEYEESVELLKEASEQLNEEFKKVYGSDDD